MLMSRIVAVGLLFALGACAGVDTAQLQDTPTRAARAEVPVIAAPGFSVRDIVVEVPDSLTVSERNTYRPNSDIVWHGDPIGDRRQQVARILHDALSEGAAQVAGDVPVDMRIELVRFHALTPKARYTVGGTHAIRFNLTLLDPETGDPLGEPRFVKADLDALGGMAAIAAENRGLTQKVRIQQHLAHVIAVELTDPTGFHSDANLMLSVIGNL